MNDKVLALIEQTDTLLKSSEDATIERINTALERSYNQLERDLLKAYNQYAENKSLLPLQRKLLIMSEIKDLLQLLNPKQASQIRKDFEEMLKGSYESGVDLSGQLAQAISNEELKSFVKVPLDAVKFQAEESGKRLNRYTEDFASRISGIVEFGLIQGWGAQKVARLIRGELGVTKGKAEMLARTESMSAHNDAIQANLKKNGFDMFMFQSTIDDRACSICTARNQKIYSLGESKPPLHPACRCVAVVVDRRWIELGLVDVAQMAKNRADGLAELKAQGKQPNYGVSPFEKLNGLTKPPQPALQPKTPQKLYSGRLEQLDRELLELEPLTPEYNAKFKEYIAEQEKESVQSYQRHIDKGREVFESAGVAKALDERLSQYKQADRKERRVLNQEMTQIMESWRNAMIASSPVSRKDAEGMVLKLKFENIENERVQERLTENMTEFFQLTRGKGSRNLKRLFSDKDNPRAYAYGNSINVGGGLVLPEILLHEVGHHIEFEDPKLLEAAQNWIQSRATGNPRSLNSLERTKSYEDDERAYPDKFISPYVGKVYDSATEVISMGLQYFWSEDGMLELYRKDPEHFYFTMGVLLS